MDLLNYLSKFGLNSNEIELYLVLVKLEWPTALQISKRCPIKRTTLYRILESLKEKGLIEEKVGDKTTQYSAASIEHFENLVLEKERQASELRTILPEIKAHFNILNIAKPLEISTRFYRGIRGLQHLEIKTTAIENKEILIFDSNQWDKVLSREFAENIRSRVVKNNLQIREISNSTSPDDSWTDNAIYLKKHYKHRLIPKEFMDITQDIHIFGNTIQFSGYNHNDLVGIEIVSQEYAQMLRQMFEVLWRMAK